MSQPPGGGGGGGGDVFGADHQKDDQSNNKRVVFVALKPGNPSLEKSSSSLNPRTRRKRVLGRGPDDDVLFGVRETSRQSIATQVWHQSYSTQRVWDGGDFGGGFARHEDLEVEEIREEEATPRARINGDDDDDERDESNNKASTSSTSSSVVNTTKDGDDDAEKYKRRTSMATRQLQKVLPCLWLSFEGVESRRVGRFVRGRGDALARQGKRKGRSLVAVVRIAGKSRHGLAIRGRLSLPCR